MRRRTHSQQRSRGLLARFPRLKGHQGQSTVEYMLAVALIVVLVYAAFWQGLGFNQKGNSSVAKSFQNFRKTVEAPYP